MEPSDDLLKPPPLAPAFPDLPFEIQQDLESTKPAKKPTLTSTPTSITKPLSNTPLPEIPAFPVGPSDADTDTILTETLTTNERVGDTTNQNETPSTDGNTSSKQKKVIAPIFYDLNPSPTADSTLKEKLVQERQKQLDRLLRFSVNPSTINNDSNEDLKLPRVTETTILGAKRAGVRRGFATGFDTTSAEEERKRKARIERFGPLESNPFYKPNEDLMAREARKERFGQELVAAATQANQNQLLPAKTLEVRRDVNQDVEIARKNVIHLYGVDKLSTKDVVAHFSYYGPSWCEWLNDSSCNIVFEDAFTMKRALEGLTVGTVLPPTQASADGMEDIENNEKTKVQKEERIRIDEGKTDEQGNTKVEKQEAKHDIDGMDTSNNEVSSEDFLWRPMKPFDKKGVTTPLWGRMATTIDVRPVKPNPMSKWSRTMKRQKSDTEVKLEGSACRSNPKRAHGVSRDNNSISKNSSSKRPVKMEITRALQPE